MIAKGVLIQCALFICRDLLLPPVYYFDKARVLLDERH